MTKRIVSGVFILTALGALGVILAGALTSGEQLIVRFLTAVVVAALGLYVISDLRLDADRQSSGTSGTRLAGIDVPANSTAAFMATVTGKEAQPGFVDQAPFVDQPHEGGEPDETIETHDAGVGAASSSTSERFESAVVEDAGSPAQPPDQSWPAMSAPDTLQASTPEGAEAGRPATITDLFSPRVDDDEAAFWTDVEPERGDESAGDAADPTTEPAPTAPGQADMADGSGIEQAVPVAQAEFQYSGDLEAPGYDSWPTADGVERQAEDADEADDHRIGEPVEDDPIAPTVARADGDHGLADQDLADDGSADDGLADDGSADEVASTPATAGAADPDTTDDHGDGHLNGSERSLPAALNGSHAAHASDYAEAPLARIIDLRTPAAVDSSIDAAIEAGEVQVVAALIEQGMLSVDGPISDRDVRTMVYVAFTSNELRKLLLAGGRPDVPDPEIDLGPVELFTPAEQPVPPYALHAGTVTQPEVRTQLG